jgi:SSS family solute:Na+ symporter
MAFPIWMLISVSGWIIYRFRETRALTMAQFLEVRYSKPFRVAFGLIAFLSGLIVFGIGPAVCARFFIHFCGLPASFQVLGLGISTYAVVLLILLGIALLYTFTGGQISIMVTDFLQGMFCNLVFLIILVVILFLVPWNHIIEAMKSAPTNASLLNPYKTSEVKDFNMWFFVISNVWAAYMYMTWQGTQGFNSAAKTPHEAQMSKILGSWRGLIQGLLLMMLPIGVFAIMHHAQYGGLAQQIQTEVARVGDAQLQKQLTVPIALTHMLPLGIMGMLCAVMLAGFISSHNSGLHSWGCIFIQDVLLPFRKRPLGPKEHLWLLRAAIVAVAAFIFCFSLLYRQTDYIYMFSLVAGALFSGAGAAVIGGLYWNRGTTTAAWGGMIVGGTIAASAFLMDQFWPQIVAGFPHNQFLLAHVEKFPVSKSIVTIIAMGGAILGYLVPALYAWLVLRREPFNLERMLHRGQYAMAGEHASVDQPTGWRALLPGPEFTRGDRILYWVTSGWIMLWFVIFAIATPINLLHDVSDDSWAVYWYWKLVLSFVLGAIVLVWFFIGGVRDLRDLFRTLETVKRNYLDDGTVVGHHNLGEAAEDAKLVTPETLKPATTAAKETAEKLPK